MTWTLIRYRLPVDAILMPFAASAVVFGYDYIDSRVCGRLKGGREKTKVSQILLKSL